jgi:ABC-type Zn2+ transport system substrate-binding protein/surface adhesin
MFFILRKIAVYQRNIISLLFILPLLLPNVLVISHAPNIEEYTLTDGGDSGHPHSHSEASHHGKTEGHSHGHNSSDHQHGSIILVEGNSLLLESEFSLHLTYFNFYYPPHLKVPEQPPRQYV